jgi:alkylation response protein AidB-like acyl-CoA dehydrogenase
MDDESCIDPSIIPQLFELGLMGIEIPEKHGGSETNFFMSILAIEALSSVDPSIAVVVDVQNTLVNNAFLQWGSEELKDKYFSQLASEKIGAYALSEAGSGSDAFALATKAEDKGDHYELNGRKMWTTNGNEAEIFIIFANLNPDAGYKGITAFVVEKEFEGFSVGKKEDKLGIRASSTCELLLDNCKVPKENVLGEIGKGYKVAMETLNEGRIGIGAQMVGLAQGVFDYGLQYTKEREQFGKPISSFQGLQFQLAQAATELEAARLMVYNAARLKEAGKTFIKEAAMAKLFSSQLAQKIASLMVEVLGGYGFTREYPVEKFYRDSKIGTIYEGTSNMQLQTIAKELLKD